MSVTYFKNTFLATEHRKDGDYSAYVKATSWAKAQSICDERGYTLDGKLYASYTNISDMVADELINDMNNKQRSIINEQ